MLQLNVDDNDDDCNGLFLQAVWRSHPGHQAEASVLLERHQGLVQSAVFSLHPVSLLCLHVPSHHVRRAARGGNKEQHSESQRREDSRS